MSQSYELHRKGFELALKERGVPILFNGLEKLCVASGIDRRLTQTSVGYQVDVSNPFCTMLVEHFIALGVKQNQIVEIVTSPPEITPRETIRLNVKSVRSSRSSPCIRLTLKFQDPV